LRPAEEIGFIDSEIFVEQADLGNRGLADADGADRLGLDEADVGAAAEEAGEGGGRHPAGGAAAGDDDAVTGVGRVRLGRAHRPVRKEGLMPWPKR
jgi:hypothetical protein